MATDVLAVYTTKSTAAAAMMMMMKYLKIFAPFPSRMVSDIGNFFKTAHYGIQVIMEKKFAFLVFS